MVKARAQLPVKPPVRVVPLSPFYLSVTEHLSTTMGGRMFVDMKEAVDIGWKSVNPHIRYLNGSEG